MTLTTQLRQALVVTLTVFTVGIGTVERARSAEGMRFLVSYGGTAGYQLPLWINKEFGFSKKYGVDLEIILIQAGSPNIQALVGGSLQLTQTAASSAVICASQGAPVVIVATLENKLRCCSYRARKSKSHSSYAVRSSASIASAAPMMRPF